MSLEQLLAARDLLASTKRTLQLLDDNIEKLKAGRVAIQPAQDMSTEHRTAFFGAVDDNDGENGILVAQAVPRGFGTTFTGTIRVQEDAAFVCTHIFVAGTRLLNERVVFSEDVFAIARGAVLIALKDGNTGRNLTPGVSVGPADNDKGAVPLSALTSVRQGLGSNNKNSFFSEFPIPRAGTVKVSLWNMDVNVYAGIFPRIFVTLIGYKVFGA